LHKIALFLFINSGLREATKEIGLWESQQLFTDPQAGYERLNQFLLSTSQVAISCLQTLGDERLKQFLLSTSQIADSYLTSASFFSLTR
jgi:hypothetical protein